ncbi:hypothetical protein IV203_037491 [Nitzschia inconspicua]|uniref:Uncharacterized protein n=1 Tax=Nitzschia inconspicua TaxID=303405 RepID=A0A9K3Q121_9STRA|nr:hypothetical protein IV203_037491 [Nitzschia inconspicua]
MTIKISIVRKLNFVRRKEKGDSEKLTPDRCSGYDMRSITTSLDADDEVYAPKCFRDLGEVKKVPDAKMNCEPIDKDLGESQLDEGSSIDDIRLVFIASFCDLGTCFPSDSEEISTASSLATFQASFRGLDEKPNGSNTTKTEKSAFLKVAQDHTTKVEIAGVQDTSTIDSISADDTERVQNSGKMVGGNAGPSEDPTDNKLFLEVDGKVETDVASVDAYDNSENEVVLAISGKVLNEKEKELGWSQTIIPHFVVTSLHTLVETCDSKVIIAGSVVACAYICCNLQ